MTLLLGIPFLVVVLMVPSVMAATPKPGPETFTLTETAGQGGRRLATVSFPFAEGEAASLDGASVTGKAVRMIPTIRSPSFTGRAR